MLDKRLFNLRIISYRKNKSGEDLIMQCPRCGGANCTIINETTTSGKDFSVGKGLCGYWIFGPTGLLCGLCSDGKTVRSRSFWVCNNCGYKWKV